jgi:aerobic carbon-monoxide dehydrogenase medium subunit
LFQICNAVTIRPKAIYMFASVEAFYRPATVREALQLLQNGKGSARIVAGCTDLALERDRSIRFLIDITHAGLSYIRRRGGLCAIGSTTTMAEIEASPDLSGLAGGILCRAAATCGSMQIRNLATVGGNMVNGSPAADLAPPLLALNATAVIANASGRRKMPLAEFLSGARSRALANSLLVEVVFPDPPTAARCGWSFQKFGRTAIDISVVNVATGLQLDVRQRVKWARIALGAVAPAPLRIPAAEGLMAGRAFDQALLAEVAETVASAIEPIDDVRASAGYRRELARVLTRRALEECAGPRGCSL